MKGSGYKKYLRQAMVFQPAKSSQTPVIQRLSVQKVHIAKTKRPKFKCTMCGTEFFNLNRHLKKVHKVQMSHRALMPTIATSRPTLKKSCRKWKICPLCSEVVRRLDHHLHSKKHLLDVDVKGSRYKKYLRQAMVFKPAKSFTSSETPVTQTGRFSSSDIQQSQACISKHTTCKGEALSAQEPYISHHNGFIDLLSHVSDSGVPNGTRTSSVMNITLEEFASAKNKQVDRSCIICVKNHKTSSAYSYIELVTEPDLYDDIASCIHMFCPKENSETLFLTWNEPTDAGTEVHALSAELAHVGVEKRMRTTKLRHLAVTLTSAVPSPDDCHDLARMMVDSDKAQQLTYNDVIKTSKIVRKSKILWKLMTDQIVATDLLNAQAEVPGPGFDITQVQEWVIEARNQLHSTSCKDRDPETLNTDNWIQDFSASCTPEHDDQGSPNQELSFSLSHDGESNQDPEFSVSHYHDDHISHDTDFPESLNHDDSGSENTPFLASPVQLYASSQVPDSMNPYVLVTRLNNLEPDITSTQGPVVEEPDETSPEPFYLENVSPVKPRCRIPKVEADWLIAMFAIELVRGGVTISDVKKKAAACSDLDQYLLKKYPSVGAELRNRRIRDILRLYSKSAEKVCCAKQFLLLQK